MLSFMDIQTFNQLLQAFTISYLNVKMSYVFFFSLKWPVTKNQLLNTKFQPKCFVIVAVQKEKRQPDTFIFQNCENNKKLELKFGVW